MARILVIDDSLLMRLKIRSILEAEGHEVTEASGGREGLIKIKKTNPDCIVLDLLMPDLNGTEVVRYMKKTKIDIPVIICTADIQRTTRDECIGLGVRVFLNKPPDRLDLLDAVDTFSVNH